MFIPLHDTNSLKHIKFQYVTFGLIAVNIVIFLITISGSQDFSTLASVGLGFIPAVVHDRAELPPELTLVPDYLTYVTYAFLHGDIFHIGGNMLFLWVFGDNVEDAMGHLRYLIFYLLCAVAGAYVHGLVAPDSQVPLIGASGAIAGIVSAYLILHPRVKIWVLVLMRIPLRIPAFIPLVLWILFQFAMLLTAEDDNISWGAHVGGIIAGAILVLVMRRRGVPLFDREVVTPKAVVVRQEPVSQPMQPAERPRWGRQ